MRNRFVFVPRHSLPRIGEASSLISHRDSNSPGADWKKTHATLRGTYSGAANLHQLRRMAGRPETPWVSSGMHPFKIYRAPSQFWNEELANPWRSFRVRGGLVMTTDVNGILPSGTDGVDTPYTDAYITTMDGVIIDPDTVVDYVVPVATAKFWFWVEIGTGEAFIRYGTDPTQTTGQDDSTPPIDWTSTNAWTGFPAPDASHVPIGWVNTTFDSNSRSAIRQLQVTDIMALGGGGDCPYG